MAIAGGSMTSRWSRYHIIGTPGEGFGAAGEGYFRMTAFATRENTLEAMERIQKGSL